jgi:hypothetical protein
MAPSFNTDYAFGITPVRLNDSKHKERKYFNMLKQTLAYGNTEKAHTILNT